MLPTKKNNLKKKTFSTLIIADFGDVIVPVYWLVFATFLLIGKWIQKR
jgi:hypothetical protein